MTATNLPKPMLHLMSHVLRLGAELEVGRHQVVELRNARLSLLRFFRTVHRDSGFLPAIIANEAHELREAGDLRAAKAMLEEADSKHPGEPLIKAWLALILVSLSDGLWQSYAAEVKRLPPDEIALDVIRAIEKVVRKDTDEETAGDAEPSSLPGERLGLSFAYFGLPC